MIVKQLQSNNLKICQGVEAPFKGPKEQHLKEVVFKESIYIAQSQTKCIEPLSTIIITYNKFTAYLPFNRYPASNIKPNSMIIKL